MPKQQRVDPRGQRRSLSASRDITWTKISHRGNPCAFGNDGWLSDLQCRPYGADTGIFDAMRQVMHGLAVRSDEIYVLWRQLS